MKSKFAILGAFESPGCALNLNILSGVQMIKQRIFQFRASLSFDIFLPCGPNLKRSQKRPFWCVLAQTQALASTTTHLRPIPRVGACAHQLEQSEIIFYSSSSKCAKTTARNCSISSSSSSLVFLGLKVKMVQHL